MPSPAETAAHAQRLASAGQSAQAESLLRRALAASPNNPDLLTTLGALLSRSSRDAEALPLLRRATQAAPVRPDPWYYLGLSCIRLNLLTDAVPALTRVTQLAPTHAHSHQLLGEIYLRATDPTPAESYLARARQLEPQNTRTARLYAAALQLLGRVSEAAQIVEAAARANLDDPDTRESAALLHGYWEHGDPARIREHRERAAAIRAKRAASVPPLPPIAPAPDHRLRIGFLCQDIRKDSAIARFVAAPLLHLDRTKFEVFGYCTQPTIAQMTPRLKAAAPWTDVSALTDADLLARLRADRLDILIETAGLTPGNRLAAITPRAAPIQISCIGDPRTTGCPAIDYRIIDAITDPSESDRFCTESLLQLPHCFLCYDPHEDAPEPTTSDIRLSTSDITFGSFNVIDKTGPAVIETWSSILRAVPGSRLLLRAGRLQLPAVRDLFLNRFKANGIDPARITLEPQLPSMADHLAQYARVNIALDPFPYCGTTTTCDALWQGVPVITLRGHWHAARVGASLLTAVGLPDLIADSRADYIRLAATLAADRPRLTQLRRTLRPQMAASPLGNAPAYAARFGEALQAICHPRPE